MRIFAELAERLLASSSRSLGVGVSEADILVAEQVLQLPIGGGYREFLKRFGWGGVGCVELFGLGGPVYLDIVRVTQSERCEGSPGLPMHLIPIMNDGGGNLFCLDALRREDPPIVVWEHVAYGGAPSLEDVGEEFVSWLWDLLDDLGI